ncbi:MAG: NAD(P)H-dependent oxidoreductase, partial [Pseudomonadota bacterium]
MKFIAFAATNHRTSLNAKLVGAALDMYKAEFDAGIDVEMLDMNDYEMPIYSMERQEADGVPALAQEFYDKIGAANAVIAS